MDSNKLKPAGIVPVRWLEPKLSICSFVNKLIPAGMEPVRPLAARFTSLPVLYHDQAPMAFSYYVQLEVTVPASSSDPVCGTYVRPVRDPMPVGMVPFNWPPNTESCLHSQSST